MGVNLTLFSGTGIAVRLRHLLPPLCGKDNFMDFAYFNYHRRASDMWLSG